MPPRAVVILSGGLDSATCVGVALDAGFQVYALTFDYGQRHRVELDAARAVAAHYGVEHRVVSLPFFRDFGGSALTDEGIEVPRGGVDPGVIPVTYVPGRNLVFLSVAASYAEVVSAEALYLGVNALDYSGYPDCRPEFVQSFARTANLGAKSAAEGRELRVETPLISLSKAQIIRLGTALGVPYHLTHSCYVGEGLACGECDSCRLRLKGFEEAGLSDPLPYRNPPGTAPA